MNKQKAVAQRWRRNLGERSAPRGLRLATLVSSVLPAGGRLEDCYPDGARPEPHPWCARVFFCVRVLKRTGRFVMTAVDYRSLAQDILEEVGGEDNLVGVTHCATRLRLQLRDEGKADKAAIEKLPGVLTVVHQNYCWTCRT